jgi:polyribonucleotide nucleotidyltransferase
MSTIAASTVIERVIGNETLIIETGKLAFQAHGSVTVRYGESIILATAVMSDKPREGIDFLPLTVEFEERLYSAGKIPGSFFRREGRPGQEAILACRLSDRSIRPLFPKGLRNEIQMIITVLSADQKNPPEILGMLGVSAALAISQIPFNGPIASCRVGYLDGQYIINPTYSQISSSELNMVVSSSRDAIIMVEAGSEEVSEELILEGIRQAHEANQVAIGLIDELTSRVGKTKEQVSSDSEEAEERQGRIRGIVRERITEVLERNSFKAERNEALDAIEAEVVEELADSYSADKMAEGFKNVLKGEVRRRILEQGVRPDGRGLEEIRPITCEVGLLPRTHGSGLFTRGQTQVLSIATLASLSMRQTLDTVGPESTKRYMHHYNFAPYSTGEARRVGSPGRREIGHGALAERAILSVLPSEEEFPYALRVVSEVLSSNGSTSMGSVCGSSMALMDAGVPIKAPVAGIAMGLITGENGQAAILSDIQGIEDFLGDMDFKVAGTAKGINALQMDIKITGLTEDILQQALEQARVGRLFILGKMNEVISEARGVMSPYAPKMIRVQIPVEKIGAVIGPGGRVIRAIIEETGASIDVADDGSVTIGSSDQAMIDLARSRIEGLTRELVVGDIITGKIARLTNFGVFVELLPGKDGLLRSEEMGDMEGEPEMGQEITVMVQEIDNLGRVNLSRRALFGENGERAQAPRPSPRPPFPDRDRGRPRPGGMAGGRGGPGGPSDRDRGRRPGPGGPRPSGPPRPGGPRGGGSMADRRFLGGSGSRQR